MQRNEMELRIVEHVTGRIWLIEYPVRFAGMNISARTTLLRLQDGRLFVHSPCPLSGALQRQIAVIGRVAFVIAPGNYHTLYASAWRDAYSDAQLWFCPGAESKSASGPVHVLSDEAPDAWRSEIEQVVLRGTRFMWEVLFFDRRSRTLIITDLIENYGDDCAPDSRLLRMWWRLFGMWNRPQPAPEYQFGWREKSVARACLTRALAWDFERIVLAHGKLIDHDARAVAQRAWRQVLQNA
jgi:Domain of unknown function (DUF4336)